MWKLDVANQTPLHDSRLPRTLPSQKTPTTNMTPSLKLNRNMAITVSTMTKHMMEGLLLNWTLLLKIQV